MPFSYKIDVYVLRVSVNFQDNLLLYTSEN